ncbi:MAG: glycolate oxidase iron-sulfur subunit, partial [Betaproteobacteria bacterium]|nr:glycolate oxidase iron-sulfur subunit [Betaproteobacteria bacterium]
SGCSLMVKEYGHLLRNDPAYAERARLVSDKTQDISAWLTGELQGYISRQNNWTTVQQSIAFHPPCTLQHGQQIRGQVESLLQAFGVKVLPIQDSHLCCGSAGTYSITQADLSLALRDRKLQHLQAAAPDSILSANIGCISHLQAGTELPVRHWIEWVDAQLAPLG